MTTYPVIRLSWSQLRVHEECKMKSHLIRTGHRSPVKNVRNYFHGMVVDRVMRDWLASPDHAPGAMIAMVDAMVDEVEREAVEGGDGIVRWRNASDRTELRQFCVELVRRLEPILYEKVLPYPFESATRFDVLVNIPAPDWTPATIRLTGEMDLLVQNNGWEIWDLKGTKDDGYYRKVIGQLIFYDLAILALHGEPSANVGLIQPMCTEPILAFSISDEDRRQLWSRIVRMAHDIWTSHRPCKDGSDGCQWCEVGHACPRYKPNGKTMTLGMALRQAAHATEGPR